MPQPDPPVVPHSREAGQSRPVLPLQGLTILAVEDSRFAAEALRLLCHRSGARLRRAESLRQAQRHLATYRPDAVIVDLGLPDGNGADLIGVLARHARGRIVILGTSGDPAGRKAALGAGAQGFIEKPPAGLAVFQAVILAHLPDAGPPDMALAEAPLDPDPLALRDDLSQARRLLSASPDAATRAYVTAFLGGIARSAGDAPLAQAAREARVPAGLPVLHALLDRRLGEAPGAFQHGRG